jgi:hypothetical protein
MTKLALTTALIAALSVPAWASGDKTQITPRHRHVQLPSEHQLKSKLPRKTSKRDTSTILTGRRAIIRARGPVEETEPPRFASLRSAGSA